MPIETYCEFCGKSSYGRRFCSNPCKFDFMRKTVMVVCKGCGVEFATRPCFVKPQGNFHSKECGYAYRVGKPGWNRENDVPEELRESVKAAYTGDATAVSVAEQFGLAAGIVRRFLKEQGVKVKKFSAWQHPEWQERVKDKRTANTPRGRDHPKYRDLPMEQIAKEYLSGAPTTDLAVKYDVSQPYIGRKLKEFGVKLRFQEGGMRIKCSDGHVSDSYLEFLVDEWLFSNRVPHEIHPRIPWTKRGMADFKVGDIYIEVWGVMNHHKYEEKRVSKIRSYEEHDVTVLSLCPEQILHRDFSVLNVLIQ